MADKKEVAGLFLNLAEGLEGGSFSAKFPIGLTIPGSEHGNKELVMAARIAKANNPDLDVILIGGEEVDGFKCFPCETLEEAHKKMEALFKEDKIKACVTMHYNFPLGVSTVGKVITPARGREMIIATTTGTTDANKYKAMLLNVIAGIATAKANGIKEPTVGLLNIDGIPVIEKALNKLSEGGYKFKFATSNRADGGARMRGNDLLQGTADVMVCDTLTGNLLIKMFSSFMTGGNYEAAGFGYGPCVGQGYDDVVGIVSRASGAPIIANALKFIADSARGDVHAVYASELKACQKAGLEDLLSSMPGARPQEMTAREEVKMPPKKTVEAGIPGIDVIEIEDACKALWKEGIYAETGMGCTGPVIMVSSLDLNVCKDILKKAGYIS
ncbi:MAG: glycine/sarcosine/betaine reductase complex component C subunit alpha [Treponema sp.]